MLMHLEQTETVTTDFTTVLKIEGLKGNTTLNMEVVNGSATIALADFQVRLKDHPHGAWYIYIAGATWATTPSAVTAVQFPFVLTRPDTLAATGTSHVIVKLYSAWAVQVQAKAASSTVAVTARGSIG